MAQYLGNLHSKRKITHPWEVVLRPHAYRDEITFALKPDLNVEKPKNLTRLQTDIQVIDAGDPVLKRSDNPLTTCGLFSLSP